MKKDGVYNVVGIALLNLGVANQQRQRNTFVGPS